ncbi:hypothetical protein K469DRAFT_661527 [Zopfia rhizophila CBS 207.26]|uniref:Uncharacterized protein n=1 Tax=Zopfia rhizophila CBS 207.26 TaxID=1314779 RepID=A0A6A6E6W7_9PEZI|nr:hypothetical protein K469DRAFT_661527 [Zopfia rhizophila CBS 207.26]
MAFAIRLIYLIRSLVSFTIDSAHGMSNEDRKNIVVDLIVALQSLPVARLLPFSAGRGTLCNILLQLGDDFDIDRVIPLVDAVRNNESDEIILSKAYVTVTGSTPPRPLSYPAQTPWMRNTSSFRQLP